MEILNTFISTLMDNDSELRRRAPEDNEDYDSELPRAPEEQRGYVLTVSRRSYGDHVQHFKVLQDRSGQYFVWEEMFFSLNQMLPTTPTLCLTSPPPPSQLRFLRGDIIDLLDCSDSLRWRGRCHGRVGFFPRSMSRPSTNDPAPSTTDPAPSTANPTPIYQ
ncbi:GRB2-related adapter protein-like [Salmo salar]|uniref:GRB2-related adapter protein-like n=1 Tax=Salmo salar TaxID=8030 RepID=A0ABM3ELV7_SALSA|nr:GRB2-related adapter protein-like [Salmo salar]